MICQAEAWLDLIARPAGRAASLSRSHFVPLPTLPCLFFGCQAPTLPDHRAGPGSRHHFCGPTAQVPKLVAASLEYLQRTHLRVETASRASPVARQFFKSNQEPAAPLGHNCCCIGSRLGNPESTLGTRKKPLATRSRHRATPDFLCVCQQLECPCFRQPGRTRTPRS